MKNAINQRGCKIFFSSTLSVITPLVPIYGSTLVEVKMVSKTHTSIKKKSKSKIISISFLFLADSRNHDKWK